MPFAKPEPVGRLARRIYIAGLKADGYPPWLIAIFRVCKALIDYLPLILPLLMGAKRIASLGPGEPIPDDVHPSARAGYMAVMREDAPGEPGDD